MNIIDSTHLELRGKSKIAKHFKGHVQLDLCDPLTGKVKERVEGENTFTNALESVFNGLPYGLGNKAVANVSQSTYGVLCHTPVNDVALGGVLMFPSFTNPSDLNDLYEPLTNYPIAYASKSADTTVVDSRLGVFNALESGEIEGGGFKNVYDWSTSGGNGVIGGISLSHKNCWRYYNNLQTFITNYNSNNQIPNGSYLQVSTLNYYLCGANKDGIFYFNYQDRYTVMFKSMPVSSLQLLQVYNSTKITADNYDWKWTPFDTSYAQPLFYADENYLYAVATSGGNNSTVYVKKLSLADHVTAETITLSTGVSILTTSYNNANTRTSAIRNGYLYIVSNSRTAIYKINLSNSADITEITLPVTVGNGAFLACDGKLIYVIENNIVIGEDDVARYSSTTTNMCSLYRYGVWAISGSQGGTHYLSVGASVIAPYLATKYTLDSAVTKTADKTMKLSYSVRQV